jgi:hypothetical protein
MFFLLIIPEAPARYCGSLRSQNSRKSWERICEVQHHETEGKRGHAACPDREPLLQNVREQPRSL